MSFASDAAWPLLLLCASGSLLVRGAVRAGACAHLQFAQWTLSFAPDLTESWGHTAVVRRRYVLWPRIDQKTCLKAVVSAGLEAVPLALAAAGDELRTDVAALEAQLLRLGPANVVAVVTTTSCFAPRAADDIVAVRHSINVFTEARRLVRLACVELPKFTAVPLLLSAMRWRHNSCVLLSQPRIRHSLAFGIIHAEFCAYSFVELECMLVLGILQS